MTKNEVRVAKIMALVESCLHDIAGEHDTALTMAPAMVEFFTDLQRALIRASHERLLAFMGRKDRKSSDD